MLNFFYQLSALYIVFFIVSRLFLAYYDALKKEGVDVKIKTIKGVPHGFWSWPGTVCLQFNTPNSLHIPLDVLYTLMVNIHIYRKKLRKPPVMQE